MTFIVMSQCIGTKDLSCVDVCPVECFFDAGDMLLIRPDECIDCDACVAECPVSAILPEAEVPDEEKEYIEKNYKFFEGKSEDELEEVRMKG